MTANPVPRPSPVPADTADPHSRLARWAVGLAAAVAVVVTVSYTIFAVAYAVGGSDAISDNWVGYLGGFALLGGLVVSLGAFVMAVVARVKRQRWALLWLPLSLFPALLAVVVIAEAFWIE